MNLKNIPFFVNFYQLTNYRKFYISSLILLALGMPLSPALVSLSQIILLVTWLVERNFPQKFIALKKNKTALWFLLLPLLSIIWLANTSDFAFALHDIKIKLPLLIIPLILGSIDPLENKELKWILWSFVFATFCGTCASLAVLTGLHKVNYVDIRSASVFISHIRFGLMILLSLVIVMYYSYINRLNFNKIKWFLVISLCLWLCVFIIILQSLTSWLSLSAIIIFAFIWYFKNIPNKTAKLIISTLIILFFIGSIALVFKVNHDFHHTPTYDLKNLPEYTAQGNKYFNKKNPIYKENGHYVDILICAKELEETWPTISAIPFNGNASNGHKIKSIMIRYLTSKGLPKDREGLLALSALDIKSIEKGTASCVSNYSFIPYVKIYGVIWEIDRYIKSGDANGKSIVQRIEFIKAGLHILKNNILLGTGTGDLKDAYNKAYNELNSNLIPQNRLRAHNQYLTFLITFGVIGFLASLLSMIMPAKINKYKIGLMFASFLIMIFISMINEDTLETQAGVTFYITFYTLFAFSKKDQND